MALINFNINNHVLVKLTDVGREELRRQHNDLFRNCLAEHPFHPPKEDENGWSRWQQWTLMEELGSKCGMGQNMPFETEIKFEQHGGDTTK